ncbi:MAG: tryptophan--tRNA ligase [Candidatus Uhrbacteria bacterium]
MQKDSRTVVVTGIRATGRLHYGTYLGVMRDAVALSRDPEMSCFFFVANLHTLTTRPNPAGLLADQRGIVRDYLAAGIDPEKSVIYAQSSVLETVVLSWLLSNLTPVGSLVGMPHYKEKKDALRVAGFGGDEGSDEDSFGGNAGLLNYPVLMAADILGVQADLVPVGQDQHPHVEFARRLARSFNRRYGNLFPIPDLLEGEAVRAPSLQGGGKMSKSDDRGVIYLDDPPETIQAKFRVAVTDPQRQRRRDPGNPSVCNIFTYHHLVSSGEEIAWAQNGCLSAGIGCAECKQVVSGHVVEMLAEFRERRVELDAKPSSYFDEILREGGLRARACIKPVVEQAMELMGVPSF